MDSPASRQIAAFHKHWSWIFRLALLGLVIWTVLDREKLDPKLPLAIGFFIFFVDILLGTIRRINRRDDPQTTKPPSDPP